MKTAGHTVTIGLHSGALWPNGFPFRASVSVCKTGRSAPAPPACVSISDLTHMLGRPRAEKMAADVTFSPFRPRLLSTAVSQALLQAPGDSAAYQATTLPLAAPFSRTVVLPRLSIFHRSIKWDLGGDTAPAPRSGSEPGRGGRSPAPSSAPQDSGFP